MFRDIFRFSQTEVDHSFAHSKPFAQTRGLKVLRIFNQAEKNRSYGKFLIVAARTLRPLTIRNLVKRRIKAIIYEEQLYATPGTYILILYPATAQRSYEELKQFLMTLPLAPQPHE